MNKDEIIKRLTEQLEMSEQVKRHEVLVNAEYKKVIVALEDQLATLGKINDKLFHEIAHYKERLRYISTKLND